MFKEITPFALSDNVFNLLHKDWMLITAGNATKFNSMTASWGGFGVLWNKPVAYVVVRPQRYTREFLDSEETFTLSFFTDEYRSALQLCGKLSGRDSDKMKEIGLHPHFFISGSISFNEARLVFDCRKAFVQQLSPDAFVDKSLLRNYPSADYHFLYVGAIEKVYQK
jgi:flavin reductase (DIM6/NTAB) family NADH-FMN oxidoreductase RutF